MFVFFFVDILQSLIKLILITLLNLFLTYLTQWYVLFKNSSTSVVALLSSFFFIGKCYLNINLEQQNLTIFNVFNMNIKFG